MRIFWWIHLTVVAGVLSAVGVASLSDSVTSSPGTVMSIAARIATRLTPGMGLGIGGGADLPIGADTVGHFIAWTGVGIVASGLVSGFAERMNLFLGLFALSALIEVGQRYLSWSRVAEFSDLVANGVGLAVGFASFWVLSGTIRRLFPRLALRTELLVRSRLRWL